MSTICCLYSKDPGFPAADQHPDAVRYEISIDPYTLVDAVGGRPTDAEIDAIIHAPNGDGFISALKLELGGIVAVNALMVAYPAFLPAVQAAGWTDVQALILHAAARGAISQTQYDAFKAAAAAHHIPVTLP